MTTGKTIALTRWTFVGKVMSLLFNMLSRLGIAFVPRSKRLLISWLQSPSAVTLEPLFFHTPQLKGSTRKGIKFWREKLIINSAGRLGFRGTQFYLSYGPGTVLDM